MLERARLTSIELDSAPSPFALFDDWFAQAKEHEPNDPNAMAIASVDPDGPRPFAWFSSRAREIMGLSFTRTTRVERVKLSWLIQTLPHSSTGNVC